MASPSFSKKVKTRLFRLLGGEAPPVPILAPTPQALPRAFVGPIRPGGLKVRVCSWEGGAISGGALNLPAAPEPESESYHPREGGVCACGNSLILYRPDKGGLSCFCGSTRLKPH